MNMHTRFLLSYYDSRDFNMDPIAPLLTLDEAKQWCDENQLKYSDMRVTQVENGDVIVASMSMWDVDFHGIKDFKKYYNLFF